MISVQPIEWGRTPLVLFDVGHVGHTGARRWAEAGHLREDMLALAYTMRAIEVLRLTGVDAYYAGPGRYHQRQGRARALGADAYIAAHCNAGAAPIRQRGNPRRHLALVDPVATMEGGRGLAGYVLTQCRRTITGDPYEWRVKNADPGVAWTQDAYSLVSHLGAVPGMVFEPGFIDEPEHAHLWTAEGLHRLGECLALGILDFLISRGLAS